MDSKNSPGTMFCRGLVSVNWHARSLMIRLSISSGRNYPQGRFSFRPRSIALSLRSARPSMASKDTEDALYSREGFKQFKIAQELAHRCIPLLERWLALNNYESLPMQKVRKGRPLMEGRFSTLSRSHAGAWERAIILFVFFTFNSTGLTGFVGLTGCSE